MIELRWATAKLTKFDSLEQREYEVIERVLQYRQKDLCGDVPGVIIQWGDWQDVPEVLICY